MHTLSTNTSLDSWNISRTFCFFSSMESPLFLLCKPDTDAQLLCRACAVTLYERDLRDIAPSLTIAEVTCSPRHTVWREGLAVLHSMHFLDTVLKWGRCWRCPCCSGHEKPVLSARVQAASNELSTTELLQRLLKGGAGPDQALHVGPESIHSAAIAAQDLQVLFLCTEAAEVTSC